MLEFDDEYQIEEFPDYLSDTPIIASHVQGHIKSKIAVSVDFSWFEAISETAGLSSYSEGVVQNGPGAS